MLKLVLMLLFLIYTNCTYISPGYYNNTTMTNFSYGSCYRGFLSERFDIFKTVNLNNPQLWVWLGDAAYVHALDINYLQGGLVEEFVTDMYQSVLDDECKNVLI